MEITKEYLKELAKEHLHKIVDPIDLVTRSKHSKFKKALYANCKKEGFEYDEEFHLNVPTITGNIEWNCREKLITVDDKDIALAFFLCEDGLVMEAVWIDSDGMLIMKDEYCL